MAEHKGIQQNTVKEIITREIETDRERARESHIYTDYTCLHTIFACIYV